MFIAATVSTDAISDVTVRQDITVVTISRNSARILAIAARLMFVRIIAAVTKLCATRPCAMTGSEALSCSRTDATAQSK